MKIITVNTNGIRSAYNKGIFSWLSNEDPDIICIQETKIHENDITPNIRSALDNYYSSFFSAQKKGYSGVAIYAKKEPKNIIYGLDNNEFDYEGRYIQFDYDNFSIASLYLPSGTSGEIRQEKKFCFMDYYIKLLQQISNSKKNYIICGDWNIAHKEIDLKNWKSNEKNSGFLPEERQWLTKVLDLGFVDAWRQIHPTLPGYTWWSHRANAYNNNVGWRIDYQIITPKIATLLSNAYIYKEQKFSDHAPLIIEYNQLSY